MNDDKKLIFYIDAYTPETIPMAKLAEYMTDFAALLGKDNAVHFLCLEKGSTKIAARVEFEDIPKITNRLNDVRRGDASKDAQKAFIAIDARLANDNAIGRIFFDEGENTPKAELLVFPGRDRPRALSYGPFTQDGTLDGILISIGGKDDTVPVRLQNGDVTYSSCDTTRVIAREMAKHLFEPVRIHGSGRWLRETNGSWTLKGFRIHRFDVLESDSLHEAVAALRAVQGSRWNEVEDPLALLAEMRRAEDELH